MVLVGTRVVLVGLKTAALNGTLGVVVQGRTKPNRVPVLIDGDAVPKSFAETNLNPASIEAAGECPICLDHGALEIVDDVMPGMCPHCGQTFCGSCFGELVSRNQHKCPTCRQSVRSPFVLFAHELQF